MDEIKNIKEQAAFRFSDAKNEKLTNQLKKAHNRDDLEKAAQQFESLFIYQMLKAMRKTIIRSELLGEGFGGEIFEGMMDEQLAEQIATAGRLGLAELVIQSLSGKDKENPISIPTTLRENDTRIFSLPEKLKPYLPIINQTAKDLRLNPRLISAVILAESNGDPMAVSSRGAKGLMQLMPATADSLNVADPHDPWQNIQAGSRYLKNLLQQFNGDLKLALAAYNAGPGTVKKYNGIPPYQETQQYVKKVLSYFHALRLQE